MQQKKGAKFLLCSLAGWNNQPNRQYTICKYLQPVFAPFEYSNNWITFYLLSSHQLCFSLQAYNSLQTTCSVTTAVQPYLHCGCHPYNRRLVYPHCKGINIF